MLKKVSRLTMLLLILSFFASSNLGLVKKLYAEDHSDKGQIKENTGIAKSIASQGIASQSGVVQLEEVKPKHNAYAEAQNGSIQYLEDLKSNLESLRTNKAASIIIESLNKDQLLYFTSAYLLCISKKGSCNFILDTIMESDFQLLCKPTNGACEQPKSVSCTNMNSFWKTWLAYDFEQRQNHILPVGLMGENNRFRQEDFPAYLKCNSTQIKPLTKILSGEQTLQRRYEINKNILSNIEKTTDFFRSIKKNIRNIFLMLGVQEVQQEQGEKTK